MTIDFNRDGENDLQQILARLKRPPKRPTTKPNTDELWRGFDNFVASEERGPQMTSPLWEGFRQWANPKIEIPEPVSRLANQDGGSEFLKRMSSIFAPKTGTIATVGRELMQDIGSIPLNEQQQKYADTLLGGMAGVQKGVAGFTGFDEWLGKKMYGQGYERYQPVTTSGKVADFAGGVAGFALSPTGKLVGKGEAAVGGKLAPLINKLPKFLRGGASALGIEAGSAAVLGGIESKVTDKPFLQTFGANLAGGLIGRGVFGGIGKLWELPKIEFDTRIEPEAILKDVDEPVKNMIQQATPKSDAGKALWGLTQAPNIAKKLGLSESRIEKMNSKQLVEWIEKEAPHLVPSFTGNKTIDNAFSDWVNGRRTTELSAINAKEPFIKYDADGIDAIHKANRNELDDVRNYFDTVYKQLRARGADFGYKDGYLPQLWVNKKEEVERVFKTLNPKSKFTKESVLANYKEGIEEGLTPRFSKLSDLVGWYHMAASKMAADKDFLDYLDVKELIKVRKDAKPGWVRLDAEGFPLKKTKTSEGVIEEHYYAPADLAKKINNYLKGAQVEFLKKTADYASTTKNLKLAGGVPGTGINAHGFNILVRSTLSRNNPIGGMFDAGKWILNPKGAGEFISQSMPKAQKYSKYGLTLSTEDFAFTPDKKVLTGNILQKAQTWLGNGLDKYLGDPLFRNAIPALKIKYMDEVVNDFMKNGVDEDTALREAAKITNNIFGGINYDQIGRNKDMQNVLRTLILAPDWVESTIRTAGGIGKAFTTDINNVLYKPYRVFTRNFIFLMITKLALEEAIGGGAGEEGAFNFDTGTYTKDGKKRVIRPFGTGADMFRLPYDVATSIVQGNFDAVGKVVTNRLSMPVGTMKRLLLDNENYYGQPIYGKDKWGNPIPIDQQVTGVAGELSNLAGIPNQVGIGLNFASGKINFEEAAAQAAEVPVRYYGGPSQYESSKKKYETFKTAGLEGEELYKAMEPKKKDKKGFWGSLFGGEDEEVIPTDPLLRAAYEQEKERENESRVRELFKSGLTPSQINNVLIEEGLGTYEEASYIIMKDLEIKDGTRGEYLRGVFSKLDNQTYLPTVMTLIKEDVITNSVVDWFEDEGDISSEQAKFLKQIIKRVKDDKAKIASYGSGSKPKLPSLDTTVSIPSVPKLNIPRLEPLEPLRPVKVPSMQLNRQMRKIEPYQIPEVN